MIRPQHGLLRRLCKMNSFYARRLERFPEDIAELEVKTQRKFRVAHFGESWPGPQHSCPELHTEGCCFLPVSSPCPILSSRRAGFILTLLLKPIPSPLPVRPQRYRGFTTPVTRTERSLCFPSVSGSYPCSLQPHPTPPRGRQGCPGAGCPRPGGPTATHPFTFRSRATPGAACELEFANFIFRTVRNALRHRIGETWLVIHTRKLSQKYFPQSVL